MDTIDFYVCARLARSGLAMVGTWNPAMPACIKCTGVVTRWPPEKKNKKKSMAEERETKEPVRIEKVNISKLGWSAVVPVTTAMYLPSPPQVGGGMQARKAGRTTKIKKTSQ